MKRLKYIVVRHKSDKATDKIGTHEHHEGATTSIDEYMEGYEEYHAKHGSHFTDELAKWASEHMTNAHGDPAHHWSVEEVKSAFERMGYKKPEDMTWGDVAYSANMHYADYFGVTLKTEAECVRQAYADISDPDGYAGKIFNRWCSDVYGKKVEVPWKSFI